MLTTAEEQSKSIVSGVYRAECLVSSLVARGADVVSVSVRGGLPVIHINRSFFTEHLIRTGKAAYVFWGCGSRGKYKQGVFIQDGCKVVWSESIH
ncbi:hypothetical protein DOH76_08025 [Salmonella enterica subsp. enterica serovar Oranienburg]|uniref:Uncharacterized protein n=1 Tax=Salmonella enterica TaxID=28901 RepID=A0A742KW81_SALER|nr:hypothetical protein [Salmonella enterica]EBG5024769.1 hypothetical protein [Salmonella enterica subsp. enterica serovar Oranienburg]ECI2309151.1 hypothetical protein [Salmonella enterica subsp. enterica serovar Infantis]EAS1264358.1 hypothetical protein [Salmonella enterica]EAT1445991.1 hypothetical protein [Salmonella enterica]